MRYNLEKITILNEGNQLQIDINPEIKIPEKLYKYYKLNTNSLNVLENNEIHFSHSFTMNDLMDGSFLLWDMTKFLSDIKTNHNFSSDEIRSLHHELIKCFSDNFLRYIGVFCLSENYQNDLLWSHYTNEEGFCVEIDIKELKGNLKNYQTQFFPINYGELIQIDLLDNCFEKKSGGEKRLDVNIPIFYALANKESFWSYEKEWRLTIRDESFGQVANPQEFIAQTQRDIEKENLKKRNIMIPGSVFRKVILSTIFFNNSRFESSEINGMSIKYFFYEKDEKNILIDFFTILKEKYNEKIFQVEKFLKNGNFVRDIVYQVEIGGINHKYVEILRSRYDST